MLDSMSLGQRIGQLLMVGTPADTASSAAINTIKEFHVGSVILTGRSHQSVSATKAITEKLQDAAGPQATAGTGLIIATDQEGGNVQVLQGAGFSSMPTALYQGTHYSLTQLRSHAATWGGQLNAAGVNVNLAPVMDVVSQSFAAQNAPIGYFDRKYGYTAHEVGMRGMLRGDLGFTGVIISDSLDGAKQVQPWTPASGR